MPSKAGKKFKAVTSKFNPMKKFKRSSSTQSFNNTTPGNSSPESAHSASSSKLSQSPSTSSLDSGKKRQKKGMLASLFSRKNSKKKSAISSSKSDSAIDQVQYDNKSGTSSPKVESTQDLGSTENKPPKQDDATKDENPFPDEAGNLGGDLFAISEQDASLSSFDSQSYQSAERQQKNLRGSSLSSHTSQEEDQKLHAQHSSYTSETIDKHPPMNTDDESVQKDQNVDQQELVLDQKQVRDNKVVHGGSTGDEILMETKEELNSFTERLHSCDYEQNNETPSSQDSQINSLANGQPQGGLLETNSADEDIQGTVQSYAASKRGSLSSQNSYVEGEAEEESKNHDNDQKIGSNESLDEQVSDILSPTSSSSSSSLPHESHEDAKEVDGNKPKPVHGDSDEDKDNSGDNKLEHDGGAIGEDQIHAHEEEVFCEPIDNHSGKSTGNRLLQGQVLKDAQRRSAPPSTDSIPHNKQKNFAQENKYMIGGLALGLMLAAASLSCAILKPQIPLIWQILGCAAAVSMIFGVFLNCLSRTSTVVNDVTADSSQRQASCCG